MQETPVMIVNVGVERAVKFGLEEARFVLALSDVKSWKEEARAELARLYTEHGLAPVLELNDEEAASLGGCNLPNVAKMRAASIAENAILQGRVKTRTRFVGDRQPPTATPADAPADGPVSVEDAMLDEHSAALASALASAFQGESGVLVARLAMEAGLKALKSVFSLASDARTLAAGIVRYNHLRAQASVQAWETLAGFVPVSSPAAEKASPLSLEDMLRNGMAREVPAARPASATDCTACAPGGCVKTGSKEAAAPAVQVVAPGIVLEHEFCERLRSVLRLVPYAGTKDKEQLLCLFYSLCQRAVDAAHFCGEPARENVDSLPPELRQELSLGAFDFCDTGSTPAQRENAYARIVEMCVKHARASREQAPSPNPAD